MGHYASEMNCNTCGLYLCRCPKKKTKTKPKYYINENFEIVEVDSNDNPLTGDKFYFYCMATKFSNYNAACIARQPKLDEQIAKVKAELERLKQLRAIEPQKVTK